jgi:hypothetical protein
MVSRTAAFLCAAMELSHRITPTAVQAFRRGDAIRLHEALGLKRWQVSPLDVDTAHGEDQADAWGHSFALARELRAVLMRGD